VVILRVSQIFSYSILKGEKMTTIYLVQEKEKNGEPRTIGSALTRSEAKTWRKNYMKRLTDYHGEDFFTKNQIVIFIKEDKIS
jgi:hypothetical protein